MKKVFVFLDAIGKLALGLVLPAGLFFGRLGAGLDLGKIAATLGQRFFGKSFGLGPGGFLGFGSRLGNGVFERGLGCRRFAPGLLGLGLDRQPRGLTGFLRLGIGVLARRALDARGCRARGRPRSAPS